jgi:lipopolysaccharide/colanic/teichoic acid biosynthesis glycosyltransferase
MVIKLDSTGKVLFKQARVGKNGEIFEMVKFRTMYHDDKISAVHYRTNERGEREPVIKVRNDSRVTRVGKFLRKYSLDELPQLINVLKGNMSLVGPRPPVLEEVKIYNAYQKRRLSGKPGLTGLAQISGRTDLNFSKIVELDIEYLQNRSVWLYWKVLILTIPCLILGKSSY